MAGWATRAIGVAVHPGGPRRAGGSLITVLVDDLDARILEVGSRGLEPAERETYSNGIGKATYRDDDGNEIGFGGAPRND